MTAKPLNERDRVIVELAEKMAASWGDTPAQAERHIRAVLGMTTLTDELIRQWNHAGGQSMGSESRRQTMAIERLCFVVTAMLVLLTVWFAAFLVGVVMLIVIVQAEARALELGTAYPGSLPGDGGRGDLRHASSADAVPRPPAVSSSRACSRGARPGQVEAQSVAQRVSSGPGPAVAGTAAGAWFFNDLRACVRAPTARPGHRSSEPRRPGPRPALTGHQRVLRALRSGPSRAGRGATQGALGRIARRNAKPPGPAGHTTPPAQLRGAAGSRLALRRGRSRR